MQVLGIETSCDETGVALYDTAAGLRAHALHSQVALHRAYGGVVPELASRDHVRRLVPLVRHVLARGGVALADVDAIAYTEGPGLAGALLVGASVANGLGFALGRPVIGVHHLEGHLLSPLLATPRPQFPFVALLVSGGHSQLFEVAGVGRYRLLGDTLDDAAGEAFDKSAKLLGLPYPGGPALAALAQDGAPGRVRLPRPMLESGDLDMSFSGLKTAVMTLARQAAGAGTPEALPRAAKADIAAEFQAAVVDVLAGKAMAALAATGHRRLVVAGGVGANRALRERLRDEAARRTPTSSPREQGSSDFHGSADVGESSRVEVYFPDLAFCTDNGAMIALAGALRLAAGEREVAGPFGVRPRWPLATLAAPAARAG